MPALNPWTISVTLSSVFVIKPSYLSARCAHGRRQFSGWRPNIELSHWLLGTRQYRASRDLLLFTFASIKYSPSRSCAYSIAAFHGPQPDAIAAIRTASIAPFVTTPFYLVRCRDLL